MTKISNLYGLTNYVTANSSGNVVIAAPTSGTALYVTGSAQVTGQLTLGSTITNGTYTYTLPSATGTLALASSLGSYVPYTGATQAVNLGAYDLTVNGIKVGKGGGAVYDNTVLGDSALTSNTSGSSNTAIGYSSLSANTIAGGNTAVGTYALSSNISGGTNTAIGYSAGSSITTGSNNVIIGGYAGTSAMSGNVILSDGGGNIRFQYNGTNTLIGQSGNVGIGTTSPVSVSSGLSLTIGDNSTQTQPYLALARNSTGGYWAGIRWYDNGTIKSVIQENSNNDLLIATSNTTRLTIASTGAATFSSSVAVGTNLSVGSATGGVSAPTNILMDSTYRTGGAAFDALKLYLYKSSTETYGLGLGDLADLQYWAGTTSTGTHRWFTSQTERMRITSSGNVGIGTTSPQRLLDARGAVNLSTTSPSVASTSGAYADIHLRTWSGATSSPARITILDNWIDYFATYTDGHRFRNWSSDGVARDLMTITGSGNVGIGTTSPGTKLTVSGGYISQTDSGVSTYLGYDGTGSLIGTTSNHYFRFITNDTERMRITSDGVLQFSTTSVVPTTNNIIHSYGPNGFMYIQGGSSGLALAGSGDRNNAIYINRTSNIITFVADNAERMRITSGGNLLVGTTSDSGFGLLVGKPRDNGWQAAFVNTTSVTTAQVFLSHGYGYGAYIDSGVGGNSSAKYIFKAVSGGSERFVVRGDGQSQIMAISGSGGSGQLMFYNNNGVYWSTRNVDLYNKFQFIYQGSVLADINSSSGAYTALSDERKKKDIEDSSIGLTEILGLKPKLFRMKTDEDTSAKQLGFIAQQVQSILPEACSEIGEYLGLQDRPIVAALVKAVQELKAELDTLKNK